MELSHKGEACDIIRVQAMGSHVSNFLRWITSGPDATEFSIALCSRIATYLQITHFRKCACRQYLCSDRFLVWMELGMNYWVLLVRCSVMTHALVSFRLSPQLVISLITGVEGQKVGKLWLIDWSKSKFCECHVHVSDYRRSGKFCG